MKTPFSATHCWQTPSRRRSLVGAFLVSWLVFSTDASRAADQPSLASLLSEASRRAHYLPATIKELDAARKLFAKTLTAPAPSARLRAKWGELGWEMLLLEDDNKQIVVVREQEDQRRGRGFFAFRLSPDWPVALQAPHSFHDEHTRRIAIQLFQEGPFAAAAWNTVNRSTIDAAHSSLNYFQPFTRAMIQAHPNGAILQLHGFAAEKRRTSAARHTQLILGNGTRFPGRLARQAVESLRREFATDVGLYPLEVEELGGTTNQQANLTHQLGSDGFLHLEMNQHTRIDLENHPPRRQDFIKSLSVLFRP